MKIIRSVRDAKGNLIQKQPEGGVGRHRCMKCQGLCIPVRLPNGTQVMQCQGCGANYVSQSLDAKKPPRPGVVPRRLPQESARRR